MRWLAAIALLIAVLAAGSSAAWLAYQWRTPYRGYSGPAAVVDIPRGASTSQIGGALARAGVVRSALAFDVWSRWRHETKLEAGEYRFDRPMTPLEVFRQVAEGQVWVVSLTVPEGWTMFDIADAVAGAGLASRKAFLQAACDPALIRDFAPSAPSLEGFLFPATYRFPHQTTPEAIVQAMVARFRDAWASVTRNDPPPIGWNAERVVTLASLVEEETPKLEERPIIAGVFGNRLRLGYPLECDPSVVYALKLAGEYDGKLEPPDLRVASPYNTYLHFGLPPGPIGNPGTASLEAALAPAHVDYLYFVADGAGGHAFSRTLAGQRRNVRRYRQFLLREKAGQEQGSGRLEPPAARRGRSVGPPRHRLARRKRPHTGPSARPARRPATGGAP